MRGPRRQLARPVFQEFDIKEHLVAGYPSTRFVQTLALHLGFVQGRGIGDQKQATLRFRARYGDCTESEGGGRTKAVQIQSHASRTPTLIWKNAGSQYKRQTAYDSNRPTARAAKPPFATGLSAVQGRQRHATLGLCGCCGLLGQEKDRHCRGLFLTLNLLPTVEWRVALTGVGFELAEAAGITQCINCLRACRLTRNLTLPQKHAMEPTLH
jgi:hypothetical protein